MRRMHEARQAHARHLASRKQMAVKLEAYRRTSLSTVGSRFQMESSNSSCRRGRSGTRL